MVEIDFYKKTNFTKIYHIADIHIRLLKRHNEYKTVFKELKDEILKDTENAMILVAGDLAHAKNDISPELIVMISNFLIDLSSLCPTILILGNHDINLNNPNRLDTLTPIIQLMNHKNLFYLKETDIYRFGNIDFFVYSLLDTNPFTKLNPEDSDNEYKIGLYHGTIDGSVIDSDFVLKSENIKVELFNGLDMVMLGDIHKYQTLQTYKVYKNIKYPIISFSSSLIQQDYGEKYGTHGMLKWDLKERNHKFIPIENEYGYHIIKVDNGEIIEIPELLSKFPRVRVDISNTKLSRIKEIEIEIKEKYNISDFTINTTNIQNDLNQANINIVDLSNIKQPTYQNKLIFEYLTKNNIEYTEELKNEIIEINNFFNYKLNENLEILNTENVKLKEFWFSNFFSYGEDNYVSFEGMTNLVGLFANNAMGKSSFIQILLFMLFDRTTKNSKTISILNVDKDYFYGKLKFETNGINYYIEKLGEKKGKDDSVPVKIDFYYFKDNVESDENKVSLNGRQRVDTNKVIATYVGNLENALMTIFSLQKDNDGLIGKKQTDRKLLLYKFLGIDIFEKLFNMAKDESKSERDYLKNIKKTHNAEAIINLKNVIEKKESELEQLEEKQESFKTDISNLESQLQEYQKQIIYIDKILNLSELTTNKNNYELDINNSKTSLELLNTDLNNLINDVTDINTEIKTYNENELTTNINILKTNERRINEINTTIKGLEVGIENYKSNINKNQLQLEKVKSSLLELNTNILKLETEFSKYNENKLIQDITVFKNNELKINELNTSIKLIDSSINTIQLNINQHSEQLINFESILLELNKQLEINTSQLDLYNENELLQNIDTLKINEKTLVQLNTNIKELEVIIKNKEDKLVKLKDLEYNEECDFCMNNIFVKDAIETKETIEIDKSNLSALKIKKQDIEILNKTLVQSELDYQLVLKLQSEQKSINDKILQTNKSISTDNKIVTKLNTDLKTDNIKKDEYELKFNNLLKENELLKNINDDYQQYLELKNEIQLLNSQLSQLQTRQELHTNEINNDNIKLTDSSTKLSIINNEKIELENKNKELNNDVIKYEKLVELKNKQSVYKSEYQTLELKIENLNNNIINKESLLIDINNKITDYYKQQIIIEKNDKFNLLINSIISDLNTKKTFYGDLLKKYNEDYSEVKVLQSKLDELNEQLETIKKHEQTLEAYEKYMESVSKDGIPYMLMQQILPILELEINNILKQIADFYLEFQFNDSDIDINIIYPHRFKNTSWDISLTSGMESFISSIATRVALDKNSVQPKYNFLTIDEGFDVLDKINKMNLDKLLSFITKYYDFVLVISHLEIIKDYVTEFIDLELDSDGYSHISYN